MSEKKSMLERMREIERKWQSKWEASRIFEADPDPSRAKFYLTVAYPYPNSPQHIGHSRTYGLTDAYARYKRMRGYNVLFPMAFHYTGTPILAMARRLAEGDKELLHTFKELYRIPEEKIEELKDPLKMARYFHEEIKEGMRLMGYSIDWRREFTTIDPGYNRFIEWQFRKLHAKGYLVRGSHPVGWCPRCDNAVGQHDTKGDVEPEIAETLLIKFESEDIMVPVVTFRPETVLGVTNIWVNPEVEYLLAEVDGERWVISEEAAVKLRFQNKEVKEIERIRGSELVGRVAINPLTGDKVPILPASFVDPDYGTGIVMSVPGHAPYDYLALRDLKRDPSRLEDFGLDPEVVQAIEPISIIAVDGYSDLPAKDAVERLGIQTQEETDKADKATEEVYSKEYHSGRMKENTGKYAGMLVQEAKEAVKADLVTMGKALVFYEIANSPVYCRCGAKILVKIVKDQWFIDYSNPEWKGLAREALRSMRIVPEQLRKEFEDVIDWVKRKACARKSGLGTRLPFDPDWIIESLSDSTIYMAYYTVSKFINSSELDPSRIDDEFFDYVFLGVGDPEDIGRRKGIDPELLRRIRAEFTYWYPLDSRHSGRDLVWNHLTFFIFNHVAIFPREYWPRQIVVNGSVTMEGKKMSKTFGNIIPVRQAIEMFGVDPLRVSVLGSAELLSDADFSPTIAEGTLKRLIRMMDIAREFSDARDSVEEDIWDRWLLSRVRGHVEAASRALEEARMKEAIHHAFYMMLNDVEEYLSSKDAPNPGVMRRVIGVWARLLSPFAPHTAEEVWSTIGGKGFVCQQRWPEIEEVPSYPDDEIAIDVVKGVVEDARSILSGGVKGSTLHIYVAARWKYRVLAILEEMMKSGGFNPKKAISEVMKDEEIRRRGKEAVDLIKQFSSGGWPWIKDKGEEKRVLEEMKGYMEKRLGLKVVIQDEEAPTHDPKNRAGRALPGKPALYIE